MSIVTTLALPLYYFIKSYLGSYSLKSDLGKTKLSHLGAVKFMTLYRLKQLENLTNGYIKPSAMIGAGLATIGYALYNVLTN